MLSSFVIPAGWSVDTLLKALMLMGCFVTREEDGEIIIWTHFRQLEDGSLKWIGE